MNSVMHANSLVIAAEALREAYNGNAVPPLRGFVAGHDLDQAYQIQAINTKAWVSAGRRIVGRKIGLTSRAVQSQIGVGQPDFGVLFADMQIADGGLLDPAKTLQPKAEAEIAFIMGRDLDVVESSLSDVAAAIDHAVAAIEIVDSRIADWDITLADTVADNGSSAYFVLGTEARAIASTDFYSCGMVMEVRGDVASVGAGAACLDHPFRAVQWLAHTLSRLGEPLRAGDIVLSGALGPMATLRPGDDVKIQIGGIGSCSFQFGMK